MNRHPRSGLDHFPEVIAGLLRQDLGDACAKLRGVRAVLTDIAKALAAPVAEYEFAQEMRERAAELAGLTCEILAAVWCDLKAQPWKAPATVEEFLPLGEIAARISGAGTTAEHAGAMLAAYESVRGER
jgi:hypothetical protein